MVQDRPATIDDREFITALKAGDEQVFETLIEMYYASMLRVALMFVSTRGVAEEVIQDTWIGVLRGLDSFQGRSSFKTWLFTILTNRAKTQGQREGRYINLGSFAELDDEPAVDPQRFRVHSPSEQWPNHWVSFPQNWDDLPETRLLSTETRELLYKAIDLLPPAQREVILLRDIEGWDAEEVCNTLEISQTNQRVLLHRARSKVRRMLEDYLGE